MKRLFDVIASLTALVLLSPLFLILAFAVVIGDGFPVFFKQERVGKSGKTFRLLKFRSMYKDAEKRGQLTVGEDDPRVTPSGRVLRRYKLDELPQLMNVLKGDMSVVGPRPEVPKYVAKYTATQREVLSVRPGLTDPASLSFFNEDELLGRSEDPEQTYIEEILPLKTELQRQYVYDRSFLTDLRIILQTLRKILS